MRDLAVHSRQYSGANFLRQCRCIRLALINHMVVDLATRLLIGEIKASAASPDLGCVFPLECMVSILLYSVLSPGSDSVLTKMLPKLPLLILWYWKHISRLPKPVDRGTGSLSVPRGPRIDPLLSIQIR
jgi:hypothetical protein